MRYYQCGQCATCGAPVHMYDGAWGSILPPQPTYTCMCFPRKMSTGTWKNEVQSPNESKNIKLTKEQENLLAFMYSNCLHNRQSCGDTRRTNLEHFWSGNLSMLHTLIEMLGLKFDWMNSRYQDFNEYVYSDKKPDEEQIVKMITRDWDYKCGDGCCYEYGIDLIVNGKEITRNLDMYDFEITEKVLEALDIKYEIINESESN